MKNIISIFVVAITIIAITTTTTKAQVGPFGGGDGYTEATAYQIHTIEHLEELKDSVHNDVSNVCNWSLNKYFKLMNNITDSVRFVIGYNHSGNDAKLFQGNFDGQNYTITLAIDNPQQNHVALFAFLGSSNTCLLDTANYIRNLKVNGYVKGGIFAAGIVAVTNQYKGYKKVYNCINMANITSGAGGSAGGVVGGIHANGGDSTILTRCINLGNVYGEFAVGGIVGDVSWLSSHHTFITNNVNNGYVKGHNNIVALLRVGGIVGRAIIPSNSNDNILIMDCISTGVIEAPQGANAGGICGFCP